MGSYGIKISKTGEKVQDAGLNELLFHSSYPVLKMWGLFDSDFLYTKDDGLSDFLLIEHDLGYVPVVKMAMQWWNIDTSAKETSFRRAPMIDTLLGGSSYFRARAYATDTEVRMTLGSHDGSGTSNVSLDFILAVYYDEDEE